MTKVGSDLIWPRVVEQNPQYNKNQALFTETININYIVYIINKLEFYFLFAAQLIICVGLFVSLSYLCTSPPPKH